MINGPRTFEVLKVFVMELRDLCAVNQTCGNTIEKLLDALHNQRIFIFIKIIDNLVSPS